MNAVIADLPSIASSALLGTLNISVWEARKKDKQTEAEVTLAKGARSKRAASVHKHLFSECPALEAIKSLRGEARVWFNQVTLPWDDNGSRLITVRNYLEIMNDANRYATRFGDLVRIFKNTYSTEISKQAFEMGALFDRSEYPDVSELDHKFFFNISVRPLPLAGDFRLDIGNEALTELQARCEADTQARVAGAMQDAWARVKQQVEWVHSRMSAVLDHDPDATETETVTEKVLTGTRLVPTYDNDGNFVGHEEVGVYEEREVQHAKKKRRPKLYQSMLDNGLELCGLLASLNITNDPALEEARKELESALVRVDIDSLKESPELQQATKTAMQNIMDKFNF